MTVLRWIAVLPMAIAGQFAIKSAGGLLGRLLRQAANSESSITFGVQLLVYAAAAAAFVLAGTFTAPGHQRVAALCLAAVMVLLSLLIHIVSQRNPGLTNNLHFAAEAFGAVIAAASLSYREQRPREASLDPASGR